MARVARIVVPGVTHEITQRGNRVESIFLEEDDYALYRDLLAEGCAGNSAAMGIKGQAQQHYLSENKNASTTIKMIELTFELDIADGWPPVAVERLPCTREAGG
jgi:hypothetical protein